MISFCMHKIRQVIMVLCVLIIIFLLFFSYSLWRYYDEKKITESYEPDEDLRYASNMPSPASYSSDIPSWWNVSDDRLANPCLNLNCSSDTIYVGSKQARKYYECFCGWAKIIKPQNLLCFKNDQEALDINYTKSVC